MLKHETFNLGENSHIQGDSTSLTPYLKVLGDKKAKLVLADPPYCLLTRRRKDGRLRDPKKAKIEHEAVKRFENIKLYREFTKLWLNNSLQFLDDDGFLIVWTNFLGKKPIMEASLEKGLYYHGEYTWAKWTKGGSGNEKLARAYEVAMIFGRSPLHPLSEDDVCPPRFCINNYDEEQEGKDWGDHPNHKSYSVLEPLIRYYTRVGERVLDPFTGSGSTPAACLKLKRKISGIELRPHWAKTTQDRMDKFFYNK